MKITLHANATTSQSAITAWQTKFNALLEQIRKKRARNQKFNDTMDKLLQTYQEQIMPQEKQQIPGLVALVEKLLDFCTRKSLLRWQRDELAAWIAEALDAIACIDPDTAETLGNRLHQLRADFAGLSADEWSQHLETERAEFEKFMNTMEDVFFDGFGHIDHEEQLPLKNMEPPEILRNAEQTAYEFPKESAQSDLTTLEDGKFIRNLFRRAAAALHPDKETEPARQCAKQGTMVALLKARESGDLMTLLELYHNHVSPDGLKLAVKEMEKLCALLSAQNERLDQEHLQILNDSPIHSQLYQKLYARGAKAQKRKIQTYLAEIHETIAEREVFIANLRNLTDLKHYLQERRTQFNPYDLWTAILED